MIQLTTKYKTRPIRFLELAEHAGWKIKLYGIRAPDDTGNTKPDQQLVGLAKEVVLTQLPQPAVTDNRYGVGFLIIHQGQQRNWFLLDWWVKEDILKQRLFSSPLQAADDLTPAEADLLACVWELAVHGFERQAWIDQVLNNPNGPDVAAYLEEQFNGDV